MDRNDVLNLKDPPNGAADQCVNAAIIAGFNFFGVLVGLGATGLLSDPKTALVAAVISAGFSFFGSLAAQRGLVQKPAPQPEAPK